MPAGRYQHKIEFINSLMLVIGGRTNENNEEQGNFIDIYDTESSDWHKISSFNRYRHSIVIID
jgi:protein phosphatase